MTHNKQWSVVPLAATFGASVCDLDLRQLSDKEFEALYALWLEHALLIFPGQFLSNDEQVNFARRFGDLEFDLAAISNVRRNGSVRVEDDSDDVVQILKGNMDWHCDSTYMPVQAKGAVFTAHVVPESGGETGWADLRAGYDALDDALRETVAALSAQHSLYHSQRRAGFQKEDDADYQGYGFDGQPPPVRPLVKTHPETGRRALLIGRHAFGIEGLSEQQSETLLKELVDIVCQPPRVYYHTWQVGDAVVWDNRCLLHRATPWDMTEPRVMFHSRIAGDATSEFASPA